MTYIDYFTKNLGKTLVRGSFLFYCLKLICIFEYYRHNFWGIDILAKNIFIILVMVEILKSEVKDVAEEKKLEQNKKEEPLSPGARTAITGIFGGLFWGLIGYLAYLFSFTKVPPNVILEPWLIGDWKTGVLGQFISIFVLGLISILVAFGYLATLRKFDKIWISMLFGLVLWGIVFFVLNPVFPGIDPIREMDRNTLVTTLCLFVLYGTFIGYSISFETTLLEGKSEPNYSNE